MVVRGMRLGFSRLAGGGPHLGNQRVQLGDEVGAGTYLTGDLMRSARVRRFLEGNERELARRPADLEALAGRFCTFVVGCRAPPGGVLPLVRLVLLVGMAAGIEFHLRPLADRFASRTTGPSPPYAIRFGSSNADETAAAAWKDCISEVPCRSCVLEA